MVTRYYIHKGDKTTAGGTVTGGSDTISNDGAPVAHEGDEVQCPACNSTGKILCDGPRWPITGMDGRQTALSDDLCLCHCNPLPKLIASRQTTSMTMEDSPGSEAVQTATAHVYGAPAAAASSSSGSSGSSAGASALGAAAPFASTGSAAAAGQPTTLAASGVNEEDEAECHAQYEEEMEVCNAARATYGSFRYFQACSERAFQRYQQCRGF